MTKFIFVTGGVISSQGKSILSASLGALFVSRDLKTTIIRLDGYLNLDEKFINPFDRGEVFVTYDGSSTNHYIGHYERFLNIKLTKDNNITTGKVFQSVI